MPKPSAPQPKRRQLGVDDYARGVVAGERDVLGRAITLVESRRPDHQERAQELLAKVLPHTGRAHRIGVTGVPGVGKSTLVERLGLELVGRGHRVAVLAVDPTSSVTGGSILGDKTRMTELARAEGAFVRPSPSGGTPGGVARRTREAMLLVEAAGYDVVLVETVGVGQTEIRVADMVDTVLLLLLPGGGDELQGIKRGILEVVDVVAVNKADGERLAAARRARAEYLAALRYLRPERGGWRPPVLAVSGRDGDGLDELWEALARHRRTLAASGELERRRREQLRRWLWSLIEDELLASFRRHPEVASRLDEVERRVTAGELPPTLAARRLLDAFGARGGARTPPGDSIYT